MRTGFKLALAAGVAAVAAAPATAQQGQKVTGPVAVYWMSAQTTTGFGMPGMGAGGPGGPGGGGRPSTSAIMNAMMGGGGGGATKTLMLQLGSSQSAPQPSAEHLPPQALGAGPSLPLVTPRNAPTPVADDAPVMPREMQRPRGKMLIFWGCGERARPGQPVVIDFAQMTSNPQAMQGLMQGMNVRAMRPPAPGRNTTYGDWPNEQTRTQVPGTGSLVGQHTIHGNYSPEIKFALDADQDFLGPLNLTTNAKAPAGHANLGWNLVPNAQGYIATAFGGSQDTVVMWSSSEKQTLAFAMPDFIAEGDIGRLVTEKVLMGPATRTCAVPKEVLDASPSGIVQLVAYGGEANFVYPPRPQDPKVAWNQQWAVKVRYRSSTGGLLGQAMPGGYPGAMPTQTAGPAQPGQQPPTPKPKAPKASDILRGAIGIPKF